MYENKLENIFIIQKIFLSLRHETIQNLINMKKAKNLVWTGLLIIAMCSVIFYNGNNDAIKLVLLLANFFAGSMWLHASSWGRTFRKFINSLINSNS